MTKLRISAVALGAFALIVAFGQSAPKYPNSSEKQAGIADKQPTEGRKQVDVPALDLEWKKCCLRVLHANVVIQHSFGFSEGIWKFESYVPPSWSYLVEGDLTKHLAAQGGPILIKGDCLADVHIPNGTILHIQGDLKSKLTVDENCEIIIGGNVTTQGSVSCGKSCSLFVGKDVTGPLSFGFAPSCWLDGSVRADITTGSVATFHVAGDLLSTFKPATASPVVTLSVDGFMASNSIEVSVDGGVGLEASIGRSDQEPGLYPKEIDNLNVIRTASTWVVLSKGEPKTNAAKTVP